MLTIRSVGDRVLATVRFATSSRARVNARLFAFLARSLRTLPPEISGVALDRYVGAGGFPTLTIAGDVTVDPAGARAIMNMLRTWPDGLLAVDYGSGYCQPFDTAATATVRLDGTAIGEPMPVLMTEQPAPECVPSPSHLHSLEDTNDRQSRIGATAIENESRFGTA